MNLLVLDATTKSLEIQLDDYLAASEVIFTTHYADAAAAGFTEGSNDGVSNGNTPVTIVAAPGASTRRIIREITIFNNDVSSAIVFLQLNNNGTLRTIDIITLDPGESWKMSDQPAAAGTAWDGDITDIDFTSGADIGEALADADQVIVHNASGAVVARSALTRLWTYVETKGASAFLAGHLHGLTLSNNVADATNDIDIATGNCRDSTDAENMILASALTKRLDAAWAVGTGNGGLDTGAAANVSYHMWLIKRSDTGVVDALFSASATAPTMPANYDYKRLIGSIIRSAGAILGFVQDGDRFVFKTPVGDVNVLNPGITAVTRTVTTPTGRRLEAILTVTGYGATAADTPGAMYVSDLSLVDATASAITGAMSANCFSTAVGAAQVGGVVGVMTNTSSQVRSRIQISAAGTQFLIATQGWIDRRGRDA